MVKIIDSHKPLSVKEIEQFENTHNVKFTELYRKFLLDNNGGYAVPNVFNVSDDQGESVLNAIYGIGDMYDSLEDFIDIYEGRLPEGFIPIADDSNGNVICLGTDKKYYEKLYFWDHEKEAEDMSNMYFLANNIYEFLDSLYEDTDS
ncbi:hypothetical protein AB685_08645 [Bacillus sp. LL01]|uniref:SMI1/KNR4 family protein n=1 Tax=Bacillus sp. LL01 TaxID=1665556 RepID=UPI00064CEC14|nr:SMI1/KNR4 family protein [Bacillus sp. LL01]KMJ59120.1 hypothetical protein AB685_08645 [Bacillus sp. LL01]